MRKGVDARSVVGSRAEGRGDETVFRLAVEERRMLVTYDIGDFTVIDGEMMRAGVRTPGLVYVSQSSIPSSDLGGLVKALVSLTAKIENGEIDPSGGVFLQK